MKRVDYPNHLKAKKKAARVNRLAVLTAAGVTAALLLQRLPLYATYAYFHRSGHAPQVTFTITDQIIFSAWHVAILNPAIAGDQSLMRVSSEVPSGYQASVELPDGLSGADIEPTTIKVYYEGQVLTVLGVFPRETGLDLVFGSDSGLFFHGEYVITVEGTTVNGLYHYMGSGTLTVVNFFVAAQVSTLTSIFDKALAGMDPALIQEALTLYATLPPTEQEKFRSQIELFQEYLVELELAVGQLESLIALLEQLQAPPTTEELAALKNLFELLPESYRQSYAEQVDNLEKKGAMLPGTGLDPLQPSLEQVLSQLDELLALLGQLENPPTQEELTAIRELFDQLPESNQADYGEQLEAIEGWGEPLVLPVPPIPEAPAIPDTPGIPPVPGIPEAPAIPGNPETPGAPEAPIMPDTPETPVTPGTPASPDTPGTPDTPEPPDTPAVPEAPAEPDPVENTEGEPADYSDYVEVVVPEAPQESPLVME